MLRMVLYAAALGQVVLADDPLVTTSQGTMRGKVLQSRDGRDFFSFTKIPYAKPPVGERRFKISEKADNWTGILNATESMPHCFQNGFYPDDPPTNGGEDCLYLNAYTPNITGRLPVIFVIHGGAFISGSVDLFGAPKYFMDEDVVYVAPHYRLGILGFLSFEDDLIPGNFGLKDIALALEWVHKEISSFGGDPNLITVVGGSTGGGTAHIICEVPRTNGIIKGCVSTSGDGWAPWAISEIGVARKKAMKIAEHAGCNQTGDLLLQCLQSKPVDIVGNNKILDSPLRMVVLISPVVERATAPGAILTSWPTTANHNYPRIMGVCQDDGTALTLFYEFGMKTQEETENFINNFNETIIFNLHLENRTSDFLIIWERYFTKGLHPLIAIRNFISEYLFMYPAMKSLVNHPGPIYFYKLNYTQGPPYYPMGRLPFPGTPHASEVPLFYGVSYDDPVVIPTPVDIQLSKLLVKMWVNFARNQTPNSKGTIEWPQFNGEYFLDIQDSGITIGNFTPYFEIYDFWESILPPRHINPE